MYNTCILTGQMRVRSHLHKADLIFPEWSIRSVLLRNDRHWYRHWESEGKQLNFNSPKYNFIIYPGECPLRKQDLRQVRIATKSSPTLKNSTERLLRRYLKFYLTLGCTVSLLTIVAQFHMSHKILVFTFWGLHIGYWHYRYVSL